MLGLHIRQDPSLFGRIPDPPEPPECYGYWDDPDKFHIEDCKNCTEYEGCLEEYESEQEYD